MGLVDYISWNAYQPAECIPDSDEEFLVATPSNFQPDAVIFKIQNRFPLLKRKTKIFRITNPPRNFLLQINPITKKAIPTLIVHHLYV